MAKKKSTNHYVDNKRLYAEMIKHIRAYNEAKEAGLPTPQVSNYIGECIWLIANRLSTNRNFFGYTYREDMIGDAVENCLRYLHNFNPEKTTNPFAYFTQIMYYAFLRRIDKENKQTWIKHMVMENSLVSNTLVEMSPDDQSHFTATLLTMDPDKLQTMSNRYQKKPKTTVKKPRAKKGIDKFLGDEDEQI